MSRIDWLKQLSISFFGRSRVIRQSQHGWQARRRTVIRPSLEILEERCLLSGSGVLAPLVNDLSQAMADAAHLQAASVRKDAIKIGQDVSNIINQSSNSPAIDLLGDVQTVLVGSFASQAGASMAAAGLDLSETGIGLPIAVAGAGIFEAGTMLQLAGTRKFFVDFERLISGGQQQQQSASTPTSSPSIVGSYSGTLVPTDTFPTTFGGFANTPQKVTLTVHADGSGSMSISPFDGTPVTVAFPAGTAQFSSEQSVSIGDPDYNLPNGALISVSASLLPSNSNALNGNFLGENALGDEADFLTVTLTRQS